MPQTIPRITMESPSSFYWLQFLLFLLLILQCLLTCNIIFIATYSAINDEELDEIDEGKHNAKIQILESV